MKLLLALWMLLLTALPAKAAEWATAPQAPPVVMRWEPESSLPDTFERQQGVYADVYSAPADRQTAVRLARHATAVAPDLAAQLGVGTGPVMRIVIAPDEVRFRSLQPGRVPVWADGTAWPGEALIFLRSPRIRPGTASPLEQVLDHEMVHVLLGQAFGARPVPAWLQEGTAKVLAKEYTADMTTALAEGTISDSLLSLGELTRHFPASASRARLAYAQSADLIAWLRSTWGKDALPSLVAAMSQGKSADDALTAITGMNRDAVEQAWLARLHSTPLPLQIFKDGGIFITVGVLLFVVGGLVRRRRTQRKLAAWGRQDALQDELLASLTARLAEQAEERRRAEALRLEAVRESWMEQRASWVDPGGNAQIH